MVFINFFKVGAYIGIILLHFIFHGVVLLFHAMCLFLCGDIRCDVLQKHDLLMYDIPLSGFMWHIASPKFWIFYSLIGLVLDTLGMMFPKLRPYMN